MTLHQSIDNHYGHIGDIAHWFETKSKYSRDYNFLALYTIWKYEFQGWDHQTIRTCILEISNSELLGFEMFNIIEKDTLLC